MIELTQIFNAFFVKKKRNGFFIECGAYDGEGYSNTLLFELERNWTGLLIEPNYKAFKDLKEKQRKVLFIFFMIFSLNRTFSKLDYCFESMKTILVLIMIRLTFWMDAYPGPTEQKDWTLFTLPWSVAWKTSGVNLINIYARRSQKCKKSVMSTVSFCAFGIFFLRPCIPNF